MCRAAQRTSRTIRTRVCQGIPSPDTCCAGPRGFFSARPAPGAAALLELRWSAEVETGGGCRRAQSPARRDLWVGSQAAGTRLNTAPDGCSGGDAEMQSMVPGSGNSWLVSQVSA
ncbi:hypothetical protein NDU88_005084 [Pleurodeles waltl]|uniref:Uncharacterized protein n=1 Tax=Pleurodeles waltl TaxID=8319 RepID=A0AAV7PJD9_PLEWA|nr:hypothetical protein NDU88_005084 [Pleurodeles waltl]